MRCKNIFFGPSDVVSSIPQGVLPNIGDMMERGVIPASVIDDGTFNGIPLGSIGERIRDEFDAYEAHNYVRRNGKPEPPTE